MTMRTTTLAASLLTCALLGLGSASARAQDLEPTSSTVWGQSRGFSLGLRYQVDGLSVDENPDPGQIKIEDIGAGLTLVGGYSYTPQFHTRLSIGGAQHGTNVAGLDFAHSTASLEAHFRFRPDQQVCPYLFGALGGTDVRADQGGNHVKITGGCVGVGGGLLVGLSRHIVMDVSARVEAINWDTIEWSQDQPGGGTLQYVDSVEDSGGSSRLELGFLWQF